MVMTRLLEKGIEAVRTLPDELQDMAGELLLRLAERAPYYQLTPQQIEDVHLGLAEAAQGDFATDEEMAETWRKFGL
jgi:predicted transcriptional regulator